MGSDIKSSYIENRLDQVFKGVCAAINPKSILEFGILDGYSLKTFIESSGEDCDIMACDLFDDFPYNAADWDTINEKYGDRVTVKKMDFYQAPMYITDNTYDIIHIDIANDADVYKFAVEHFLPKVKDGGVLLLEGGSKERDKVYWMNEFDKSKINPYLESIKNKYNITIIEDYPSVTIIKK